MPRIAITNAAGAIVVLDPPTNAEGEPILPEGEGYAVVELSDKDAAKLDTPDARFSVTDQGALQVERVKPAPDHRAAALAVVTARAKEDPAFAALCHLAGVSLP